VVASVRTISVSDQYFQYRYLTDTEKVSVLIPISHGDGGSSVIYGQLSIGQVFSRGFLGCGIGNMWSSPTAHVFEVQQPTHNVCSACWLKGKPGNLGVRSTMLSQCTIRIHLLCTSFSITGDIYSDTCTRLAVERAEMLIWDMWRQVHGCAEETSVLLNTPGLLQSCFTSSSCAVSMLIIRKLQSFVFENRFLVAKKLMFLIIILYWIVQQRISTVIHSGIREQCPSNAPRNSTTPANQAISGIGIGIGCLSVSVVSVSAASF